MHAVKIEQDSRPTLWILKQVKDDWFRFLIFWR